MTLNAAMRIIEKEKVFLGLSWLELFDMLEKSPTTFPNRTVEAFEVYKAEIA